MYRSCIFCSAALGSNDSLERFPVGRSLAFDAEKGRLWAVCPRCARWNLAPIEERWEAIEDAERLFRDTRLRAQRENIGVAKLRDGTRLVRVGQALAGELAVWRYGESLVQRRRRHLTAAGPLAVLGGGGFMAVELGAGAIGVAGLGAVLVYGLVQWTRRVVRDKKVLLRLSADESPLGEPVTIFPEHAQAAQMVETEDGGIGVRLSNLRHRHEFSPTAGARVIPVPVVVAGNPARRLLNRAMVIANHRGAGHESVIAAIDDISAAGSPEGYLRSAARDQHALLAPDVPAGLRFVAEVAAASPVHSLALEMALHEETERRALDGELAMLEAMWREAEQIASIADGLPELPASEPPRLSMEG